MTDNPFMEATIELKLDEIVKQFTGGKKSPVLISVSEDTVDELALSLSALFDANDGDVSPAAVVINVLTDLGVKIRED